MRHKVVFRDDATDFIFCREASKIQTWSLLEAATLPARTPYRKSRCVEKEASDDEAKDGILSHSEATKQSRRMVLSADALALPQLELAHAALLMPALAAHYYGPVGVVQSCLPLVVPFSMPEMSPMAWASNKKALAYNRCVVVSIYVQGLCGVLKFLSGNMVGGFFDGMQAGMGFYSLTPDGMRFFPTYMMMAGVNGVTGLLQVLQQYNGVPLGRIPKMRLITPIVSIVSAYFSWNFLKECHSIASQAVMSREAREDSSQDYSCLVRAMGADWWPAFIWAPVYGDLRQPQERARDEGRFGGSFSSQSGQGSFGPSSRFHVFEGSGHRLGEH